VLLGIFEKGNPIAAFDRDSEKNTSFPIQVLAM
jgi:hypothetical protein